MLEQRICDICERREQDLANGTPGGLPVLQMDRDGLWVCPDCRPRLADPAVEPDPALELEELGSLVGVAAGAICHTLNLPYEPPYQGVIDAASRIAYDEDRHMSAWCFVAQWLDGTTVWRGPEGASMAYVARNGSIRFESG